MSDWRDVVVVEVVVVWVGRELVVVITSRPPSPQAPVGGAGAVVRVMVGVPGGQLVGGEGQQRTAICRAVKSIFTHRQLRLRGSSLLTAAGHHPSCGSPHSESRENWGSSEERGSRVRGGG